MCHRSESMSIKIHWSWYRMTPTYSKCHSVSWLAWMRQRNRFTRFGALFFCSSLHFFLLLFVAGCIVVVFIYFIPFNSFFVECTHTHRKIFLLSGNGYNERIYYFSFFLLRFLCFHSLLSFIHSSIHLVKFFFYCHCSNIQPDWNHATRKLLHKALGIVSRFKQTVEIVFYFIFFLLIFYDKR